MSSPLHFYQDLNIIDGVTAWYESICPASKERCRLPRTRAAESLAQQLMKELAAADKFNYEGKMYGVLLVEMPSGEKRFLKAFSGLLQGQKNVEGWVPMIDGGDRLILEEQDILAQLREIRKKIIHLETLPERNQYQRLTEKWLATITQFNEERRQNKQQRQQQRQEFTRKLKGQVLSTVLEELEAVSRRESNQKQELKRQRDQELSALETLINQADQELILLRQRRKNLSRNLQKQMHRVYQLKNFAGESQAIADLFPQGLPTGTGDCCAPKLLHYAAKHQLKPLALAEFWWGKNTHDKTVGEFYLACEERCKPILGFLLSGLEKKSFTEIIKSPELPLEIIYEDHDLFAIHKPAGLPSIPGRSSQNYDSAFARLRRDLGQVFLVHRLDQDTSGVLLFAKNAETQQYLHEQFKQRKIQKIYEALLEKEVEQIQGMIDLPLWSDTADRPRQKVNYEFGKSSQTHFIKLSKNHIQLKPITGRTHQLRVHCAHSQGLNNPILGDRLYGTKPSSRLHLYATSLTLTHPKTTRAIEIQTSIQL